MAATWKTVRVFISSTFRDMHAERDHLVRFVFPRLRERLLSHRIHFVDVDLRWGVTSEQDIAGVCREIVDQCRPRFLCMLGGRYGWVPPGGTRSITADEVHYGVLDRALADRGFPFFYFRDDTVTAAMVESTPGEFREPRGTDNQMRLADLKQGIVAAGLNPFTYSAQWDNHTRRLNGLKQFGDRVYDDLLTSIQTDPDLRDRFGAGPTAQPDEFAEENAAMEAYVEDCSENFFLGSRETVLNELLAHATANGGSAYVCLTGAPGSGKSALLANLSGHPAIKGEPATIVIRHFVGASRLSSDIYHTLRRLCHELKARCPAITADIPHDLRELRSAFSSSLIKACEHRRVVILLDAVNGFLSVSRAPDLSWLPEKMPSGARVILSTLDGPALESLRHRRSPAREIGLPPLTPKDAKAIVEQFFQRYHKRLEPEQVIQLLSKTDADRPLYLLAALEELRTLGTYEQLTARIAELPPTTLELFTWILERLENDDGFRDEAGNLVGSQLVSRFAALLGTSRFGLDQEELADLLSPWYAREHERTGLVLSGPVIKLLRAIYPPDPQRNIAALLRLLRPYLMRRGGLLDFYHGQFRAAAALKYLPEEADRKAAHCELANYFWEHGDSGKQGYWEGKHPRPFRELAYHVAHGGQRDRLRNLLLSYNWIRSRLRMTSARGLIVDFGLFQSDQQDPVRLVGSALLLSENAIASDAGCLPSQLTGRLLSSEEPEIVALLEQIQRFEVWPWLRPLNASLTSPGGALVRTVEVPGEWFGIVGLSLLPGSRFAVTALDHPLRPTLAVWELQTGRCTSQTELHAKGILAMALLPDGQRAFLALRDIDWGEYAAYKLSLAGLPDQEFDEDLLDEVRDEDFADFANHPQNWTSCLEVRNIVHDESQFLGDSEDLAESIVIFCGGHWAVVSDSSGKITVWNLDTGKRLRTMTGNTDPVTCLASRSDGRRAVSGSQNGSLRVWNLNTGRVHSHSAHQEIPLFSGFAATVALRSSLDAHRLRLPTPISRPLFSEVPTLGLKAFIPTIRDYLSTHL